MSIDSVNKENPLILFFRSEYFVLLTFIAIITPFMGHTAYLLLQVSYIKNQVYAYFFAFSFDLGIFCFAVNGRRSQATGLAFVVFTLNVCFFNLQALGEIFDERGVRFFVTVIISASGSWVVHSYVVFFNEKIGENNRNRALILTLQKQLSDLSGVEDENLRLRDQVVRLSGNSLSEEMNGDASEITYPFTCDICEQTVLTAKSRDALVKFCSNKTCIHRHRTEVALVNQ